MGDPFSGLRDLTCGTEATSSLGDAAVPLWRQKSDIRISTLVHTLRLGTFVTLLLVSLSNPFVLPREFRPESLSLTCTTSVPVNCTGSSQVGRFSICSSADRLRLNQTTSSAREPTFYQLHLDATCTAGTPCLSANLLDRPPGPNYSTRPQDDHHLNSRQDDRIFFDPCA